MTMASADSPSWIINTTEPPATLEGILAKQRLVLAWSQFVYAEGGADQVRIAFASHDVVIKGAGLDPLMHAIAAHRVASIREVARAERFSGMAGPVHPGDIHSQDRGRAMRKYRAISAGSQRRGLLRVDTIPKPVGLGL
jgi:hypothetical protein